MATGTQPPSGELAAKIRTAAKEAVAGLPGAELGDGEINRIIDRAGSDNRSMADRLSLAASLAVDSVKAGEARPVNLHSATPAEIDRARASMGLPPLQRHGSMAMLAEREGDTRQGSSARYDSMGSKTDWNSPAGQAYMRDFAIRHGVPWAANNPDLLRLGPAAIESIAQAGLKQETYSRLKTDGGFNDRNVVTLTDYANKTGRNANEMGNAISDANKDLSAPDKATHNGALFNYLDTVKRSAPAHEVEAAKKQLLDTQQKLGRDKPEQQERFKKMNDKVGVKAEQAHNAEQNAKSTEKNALRAEDREETQKGVAAQQIGVARERMQEARKSDDNLAAMFGDEPPKPDGEKPGQRPDADKPVQRADNEPTKKDAEEAKPKAAADATPARPAATQQAQSQQKPKSPAPA